MRIIAGTLKGRVIRTVQDLSVRPATGRVRETLFNMLIHRMDFDGLKVLDLFAGSGSLGFEALSHGAAHVTFVEHDPSALRYLEENAQTLGCSESVEIVAMDVAQFMGEARSSFGLVFADPPYTYPETRSIPDELFANKYISPNGYLLIEHSASLRFEDSSHYSVGPEKKFGRTLVTFFQHRREDP